MSAVTTEAVKREVLYDSSRGVGRPSGVRVTSDLPIPRNRMTDLAVMVGRYLDGEYEPYRINVEFTVIDLDDPEVANVGVQTVAGVPVKPPF